jgi:hypothetical protein
MGINIRKFNDTIDEEDIKNIFMDYLDEYSLHNGLEIRFSNTHKSWSITISVPESKDIKTSRDVMIDYIGNKKSSEFIAEIVDRMIEFGYNLDRSNLRVMRPSWDKYEIYFLFKKINSVPK